jgi:hypothetical protein
MGDDPAGQQATVCGGVRPAQIGRVATPLHQELKGSAIPGAEPQG